MPTELWSYRYDGHPFAYGSEVSYRIGALLLRDCSTIDDWGCGAQWFREEMRGINQTCQVIGIDGSAGSCDVIADLATYSPTEQPDGLFMRHVLEHNRNWRGILKNALQSFRRRMVLVLFTPFSTETHSLYEYTFPQGGSVPNISFRREDLEAVIHAGGCRPWIAEIESPRTDNGSETVIVIEATP